MRSSFLWLFLILLGAIGFLGYQRAVGQPGSGEHPKVLLPEDFFDFGKAKYGEKLTHEFAIQNKGEGVLKIERVATSCGCTTAEIDKKEIRSGEQAQLRVVFDTAAMGEATVKGRQERFVYLKTNDPTRPQVTIKIVAEIE